MSTSRAPIARRSTGSLRVAEVFGPTIQGEGPATGRAAAFVRLGGCNLSCSWCDTPYTWDATRFDLSAELANVDVDDLAERAALAAGLASLVILTGGEPLFQQGPDLIRLVLQLRLSGLDVHVETNGTLAPLPRLLELVQTWSVSPKLGNAGGHRGRQDPSLNPAWADAIHRGHDVHLKVVCAGVDDVDRAAAMADSHGIPRRRVWVMPEGTTTEALAVRWRALCELAAERGMNASHRLHVLAWGDERGR